MTIDASGAIVFGDTTQGAVVRRDPVTGACTVVSNASTGSGPTIGAIEHVAVEPSGDILALDTEIGELYRVDAVTGDRSVVSPASQVNKFVTGMAVEASGGIIVARELGDLTRIDPVTGAETVVSSSATGGGPPFDRPRGVAVESSGSLIVVDDQLPAIVRVDPVSGDRSIVSDDATGGGPAICTAKAVAVEATGDLVLTHNFPPGLRQSCTGEAVVRVDPISGDRSIVSANGNSFFPEVPPTGGGPALDASQRIVVEPSGDLVVLTPLLVAGCGTNDIDCGKRLGAQRVDPLTGDRTDLDCDCPPQPQAGCVDVAKASLAYNETKPGKEKSKLRWKNFASSVTGADFGNPLGDGINAISACIYDDTDALVASFLVPSESFGSAQSQGRCLLRCWRELGVDGYRWKDKERLFDGVSTISFKGGEAGRGSVKIVGKNNSTKGSDALPTGVAAALNGRASVRAQLLTHAGLCVDATLSRVTKDDGVLFKAKK
jgi:hypothetical protein